MSEDYKKKNTYLIEWLNNQNINYIIDFDLKKKSWIKCGGIAKTYIEPDTLEKTETR